MISKEETKELKECLKETIQNTYAEKKAIKLNNALKYIEQLETRDKRIIESIGARKYIIKEYEKNWIAKDEKYYKAEIELNILQEIMKGENNE